MEKEYTNNDLEKCKNDLEVKEYLNKESQSFLSEDISERQGGE